jgi:hypothetical protein
MYNSMEIEGENKVWTCSDFMPDISGVLLLYSMAFANLAVTIESDKNCYNDTNALVNFSTLFKMFGIEKLVLALVFMSCYKSKSLLKSIPALVDIAFNVIWCVLCIVVSEGNFEDCKIRAFNILFPVNVVFMYLPYLTRPLLTMCTNPQT